MSPWNFASLLFVGMSRPRRAFPSVTSIDGMSKNTHPVSVAAIGQFIKPSFWGVIRRRAHGTITPRRRVRPRWRGRFPAPRRGHPLDDGTVSGARHVAALAQDAISNRPRRARGDMRRRSTPPKCGRPGQRDNFPLARGFPLTCGGVSCGFPPRGHVASGSDGIDLVRWLCVGHTFCRVPPCDAYLPCPCHAIALIPVYGQACLRCTTAIVPVPSNARREHCVSYSPVFFPQRLNDPHTKEVSPMTKQEASVAFQSRRFPLHLCVGFPPAADPGAPHAFRRRRRALRPDPISAGRTTHPERPTPASPTNVWCSDSLPFYVVRTVKRRIDHGIQ